MNIIFRFFQGLGRAGHDWAVDAAALTILVPIGFVVLLMIWGFADTIFEKVKGVHYRNQGD